MNNRHPLTYAQRRIWVECKFNPDSLKYNEPFLFNLTGNLDIALLQKSWNEIVQRHEGLRTFFIEENGTIEQMIAAKCDESLEVFNLATQSLSEKEHNRREIIAATFNYKFNIHQSPLWKASLIVLGENNYSLAINFHHLVVDMQSIETALRDFSDTYNGQHSLPIPSSMEEYLKYEEKALNSDYLERAKSFWQKYLKNSDFKINLLKKDIPSKEEQYGSISFDIQQSTYNDLKKLAASHKTTLFVVLSSILSILLHRYGQQEEVVLSYPTGKRPANFDTLCGFFVNNLPMRVNFSQVKSFADIIQQISSHRLEIRKEYQLCPLSEIVKVLENCDYDLNNSLFDVGIIAANYSGQSCLNLKNISIETIAIPGIPKNMIDILYNAGIDTLSWQIEYRADYFEKEFIENFTTSFKLLLETIAHNDQENIYTIPLLDKQMRNKILIEWNDHTNNNLPKKCLHHAYEEQAQKNPDHIALVFENYSLSYKELNKKANQLAHYLQKNGVVTETLVAIALDRSLEMIIGILGILKAGGAYVPIDPSYPQDRLQFILEDTQAPLLLTLSSSANKFSHYSGKIIALDNLQEIIDKESTANPKHSISSPHNLAYIIYTSGSTGKPKGVMIEHHNVTRLFQITAQHYHFNDKDVWTLFHSYSFDFSVWEIWGALLHGGKIVIVPYLISRSPDLFYELLNSHKVTVLNQTPSAFNNLLQYEAELPKPQLHDLRYVIFGGEALDPRSLKAWYEKHPQATTHLINMYGITETTVHVTYYPIDASTLSKTSVIGKPLKDLKTYILDNNLQPAPIGVNGQLYVSGEGLARGYLNRPELTQEKFILHHLTADNAQERLYKTGDLCRYLPDGNIEYLGRIDDQIKIRGFRIELGEIEAIISLQKEAAQAVTLIREDHENKKIVAYIVPQDDIKKTSTIHTSLTSEASEIFNILQGSAIEKITENIHINLTQSLPEYMLPSAYIFLDKIPLTTNGKIDRKTLLSVNYLSIKAETKKEHIAPRNAVEQELYLIWSEVLNTKQISIHDNFTRIGGDSILSIQIISKARQKGLFLNFKDLFNHPTIAGLAAAVKIQNESNALKPEQGIVKGDTPLTPIQHWFFDKKFLHQNHYNQALLLKSRYKLNIDFLNQAFSFLIKHHDAFKFRYHQNEKNDWIQTSLPTEVDDLLICSEFNFPSLPPQEFFTQIETESNDIHKSLDITKGPVIKAALFNSNSNSPQYLLITIHHLMIDGVSWRILLEDLEKIYSQLLQNKPLSLPAKSNSYQQWSLALQKYAASSISQNEVQYWKTVQDQIQTLPIDFNNGLSMGSINDNIVVHLSQEETTQLLQQVPKAYNTEINDILLTALALAIGDWTKNYNLSLSLEGHGREDIIKGMDLSRTIGWFTTIFPVNLKIENFSHLSEAINSVKKQLRSIPHKGIDYGMLTYLTSHKNNNSAISPSLCFNYLGQRDNYLNQESLFIFSEQSTGQPMSDHNERVYRIEINADIQNKILRLSWGYSKNHYYHVTIEKIANLFVTRLRQLISHCCQKNHPTLV